MDLFRRAYKRVPTVAPQLPTNGEKDKPKPKGLSSRLAFFKRPLRLKGNSSISVPLGVVVLFPCIVLILILVLFVRHPSSPGRILMPAGAPPAIRYACASHSDHVSLSANMSVSQENQRKARQGVRHWMSRARYEPASRQRRLRGPCPQQGARWCHSIRQVD